VTFRPEQREWKEQVHAAPVAPTDDPARAARRLMTDDGFNIGVLYVGSRAPNRTRAEAAACAPADLETEFEV
jgi:2-oxoglutarate ferredoxin oxidoreductase subunit beta